MMIPEPDWKLFTTLKYRALDRYCRATLVDSAELCARPLADWSDGVDIEKPGGAATAHERYRELFWLVSERNRAIAEMFDGHSRSGALLQLMQLVRLNLLTTDELAGFSDVTQEFVERAREQTKESET